MNRTQTFAINSAATFLHHLCVIISGFIIPKIMLIYYGSEIFGLVTSISQFISYFTIVEAGLATAGVYALYEPIVNKDYDKINGIVSATKKYYTTTGHLFSALVILLAILYPFFIKAPDMSVVEVAVLVVVIGSSGALDFYTMSRYRVLLTAHQKVYIISIANIIYVILKIVITYLCARFGCNIIILKALVLASVIARSLILRLYVNHKYKHVSYNEAPDYASLSKRWDAVYLQIFGAIHNGTPIILITFLCTLQEVSVYTVFNIVIAGIMGLLGIVSTSIFPSFGEIIAGKNIKLLQTSFEKYELVYYVMLAVVVACLLALLQPFVTLYTHGVHDANYQQPLLGFLMTLNILFYNLKNPQGMLVIAGGLFKETRVQTTIQGVIAIVAGLIGGKLWGVYGIVIGIIMSNIYRDIDLIFFIPKHVTRLPVRRSVLKLLTMCVAIVVSYAVVSFIGLSCSTWLRWMVAGLVYAVVALIITSVIYILFYPRLVKELVIQLKSLKK